jgi:phosphate transport system substrate-binding protein
MPRRLLYLVLSLAVALPLAACKRGAKGGAAALTLAGSTSVQPFAEKWAELYMQKNSGAQIHVQGGGSTAGVRAVKTGAAQIGTVSRDLKSDEKDLKPVVVARDGIAVVINPKNPLAGLSLKDVRDVFSGAKRTWKDLGGEDRPITVITREEGSGTRTAFEELVMKEERIGKAALVQDSTGAVREMVKSDLGAIGYISLGQVTADVKAVPLDGVAATEANVLAGKYPLVRPFTFVFSGEPSGLAKQFLDFVLSAEGQALSRKEGLIPVQG